MPEALIESLIKNEIILYQNPSTLCDTRYRLIDTLIPIGDDRNCNYEIVLKKPLRLSYIIDIILMKQFLAFSISSI